MGEGSRFQPHALYQQNTADFNNNHTVPVGQAHWHNTIQLATGPLCPILATLFSLGPNHIKIRKEKI